MNSTIQSQASEIELIRKNMKAVLNRQKEAFLAEGFVSAKTRIDRLNRVIDLLVKHQDDIADALASDFGRRSPYFSKLADVAVPITALKYSKKHVSKWMKPVKRRPTFPLGLMGAKTWVEYQPKGVVGNMSPWNFPVTITFTPLSDILASGNRCMIKPSENTPAISELMAEMIRTAFDETEIAVFPGGVEVGQVFSGLAFDHLVFTGANPVARHIMKAAAENLVPVTLELGGKSPVIIGQSASLSMSIDRIVMGKMANAGQICVAPDYVYIPENKSDEIIQCIRKSMADMYPTLLNNPDSTSIVNARHHDRLKGYLLDARDKGASLVELNPANEDFSRQEHHLLPLTLVINPTDDMKVMQDEIFGPILPVKTYRNIQETIDYINSKPRPLVLYYFGKDEAEERQVLNNTTSGAVNVNDIFMHIFQDDLPFGGIGASGMGAYRGFHGFKAFSHAKAIFRQGPFNVGAMSGLFPPYGKRLKTVLKAAIRN